MVDYPRQKPKSKPALLIGVAAGLVLVATLGISRLMPASPVVERRTLLVDRVQRSTFVRKVRGPGSLVPENLRIVSAMTAGRIERVLVRPGAAVEPASLLIEMSNPDVQLQSLDAERQLKLAEADLANLRSALEAQRLAAVSTVAAVRSELHEAERSVKVADRLIAEGLASAMEMERARDRVAECRTRYDSESRRLDVLTEALAAQLELRRSEVERLRAISRFQQERVNSMQVRAGAAGVVQSLALEPGQWVNPGQELARVAGQERLKAVLEIPEGDARDVALGLTVEIDTRNGIARGRVSRVDPGVRSGTVTVDVAIEGSLPRGARPDLSVDGTIEVDRIENALFVGRPAEGSSEGAASLFRISADGRSATRVQVRLGRASYQSVEVLDGLKAGDEIILTDMSRWRKADRVELR